MKQQRNFIGCERTYPQNGAFLFFVEKYGKQNDYLQYKLPEYNI